MGIKNIDHQASDLAKTALDTLRTKRLIKNSDIKAAEAALRTSFREQLNALNIGEFPEFVHERLALLGITTVDGLRTLAQSDFEGIKAVGAKKLDIFVGLVKSRYGIDIPTAPSKIKPRYARQRSVNTVRSLVDINLIALQTNGKPITTMAELLVASKDRKALLETVTKAYDKQYPSTEIRRRNLDIAAIFDDIFRELRKLNLGYTK